MRQKFFLVVCFCSILVYGQDRSSKKKEKYEFIDLGKLQVEGKFVTPTDILIQEQSKQKVNQKLYDRKHFKKENFMDILNFK